MKKSKGVFRMRTKGRLPDDKLEELRETLVVEWIEDSELRTVYCVIGDVSEVNKIMMLPAHMSFCYIERWR